MLLARYLLDLPPMEVDTKQLVDDEQLLEALGQSIRATMARQGFCFITHPAQLRCLKRYPESVLRDFARKHGARLVVRAGGEAYEFTRLPGG